MVIMATMARERLSQLLLLKPMLSLDIIITVTLMVMVMDTATMDIMARGRLMPSQDTITMDMAMDMDMDMVMDTTVNKQHLFISFQNSVTSIGTCWNLVNRNTHLEKKYKKSFYEIKKNKINCVSFY